MSSRTLARVLFAVFAIAVIMGPGPGNLLINPDPADPEAKRLFLGMPVIYVWAVGWYFVQAACIVIAYLKLWKADSGGGGPDNGGTDPAEAAGES